MITIKIPSTYQPERRYILSVMFGEFLGVDIQIRLSDHKDTRIFIDGGDRELVVADGLFTTPPNRWLQPASLPKQPLPVWNLITTGISATTVSPEVPVIYGNDPNHPDFFQNSHNKIYLGLDIFGSAFFLLTRYEEVVKSDRDKHDRFPATASLAYQENFLDRPIINEYLEILWACLKRLWPRLQRKIHQPKTLVSCDVDNPYSFYVKSWRKTARKTIGDLFKRKSVSEAIQTLQNTWFSQLGNFSHDPLNTFDWIMDINEKAGNRVAFYFLVDKTVPFMDGHYDINEPRIRALIRQIHQRGHEIGLHTSYNTYQYPEQTKKEFKRLKQICAEEGLEQARWGGRQHYLRWETPTTFQNWSDAGLDYDTTLSFADIAGFRCGICYEFGTFNIKTRQTLNLKERPLVVMECTIIDKIYMNLGLENDAACQLMEQYKQRCHLFNGYFTLLWHNTRLIDLREINLYKKLIYQ